MHKKIATVRPKKDLLKLKKSREGFGLAKNINMSLNAANINVDRNHTTPEYLSDNYSDRIRIH